MLQMPKTGSQTVEATLRQNGWEGEICRIHFQNPEWVEQSRKLLQGEDSQTSFHENLRVQVDWANQVREALALRQRLQRWRLRLPRLQVISAVRDPIGLTLSALFQNHEKYLPDPASLAAARCAQLVQDYPVLPRVQNWFDDELNPVTRVDVFARPFPHEKGFDIYENGDARVLVYRFENLRNIKTILETFLGRAVERIVDHNVSDQKAYAAAYAAMKKQLRFPAEFVREQCQSRMMRHFYSEEERQALVKRWSQ
jgi:hypothetical protein